MSAAEDYRELRASRIGYGRAKGSCNDKGMVKPKIITWCSECGKEIPFEASSPGVCEECWNRINGYEQSGRWKLH